jgi:hypothetical protein
MSFFFNMFPARPYDLRMFQKVPAMISDAMKHSCYRALSIFVLRLM